MAFNFNESGDANAEFTTNQEHHHDVAAMTDLQQTVCKILEPINEHFSNIQRCLTAENPLTYRYFDKTLLYIEKAESSLKTWYKYGNNKFIPNLRSKNALLHFLEKRVDDLKFDLEKLVSEAMTNCCQDGLEMSRERLEFWKFNSFPSHSAYVQAQALNLYMEMYTWYFSTWLNVLDNSMQDSLEEFCKKVSAIADKDAAFLNNLEGRQEGPISKASTSQDSLHEFYNKVSEIQNKGAFLEDICFEVEVPLPEASISQDSLDSEPELSDHREFQDCSTETEDGESETWHTFKAESLDAESMACAESQAALDKATQKYQSAISDLEQFQSKVKGASIRAMDQVFVGPYAIRKAVFQKALEPEFGEINELLEDYRKRLEDISYGKIWDTKRELETADSAEHAADMAKMNCISRVKLMIRLCLYYFYSYVINHLKQYMTAANIIHKGLQKYEMDNEMASKVDNTMKRMAKLHSSWTKDLRQHMKHLCEGKMRLVQKLEQTEAYFKHNVEELNELFLSTSQNLCEVDHHIPVRPSGYVYLRTTARSIFYS